jgi:hypothetical protein
VLADLTASAIQLVAQAGMVVDWAAARPASAMTARAEYEYCILTVSLLLCRWYCLKRAIGNEVLVLIYRLRLELSKCLVQEK